MWTMDIASAMPSWQTSSNNLDGMLDRFADKAGRSNADVATIFPLCGILGSSTAHGVGFCCWRRNSAVDILPDDSRRPSFAGRSRCGICGARCWFARRTMRC